MNRLAFYIDDLFRNIKMRYKLLILFTLISLVPLLAVMWIFYQNSVQALQRELGLSTVEITKQVESRLDSFMQENARILNLIRFQQGVQQFLTFRDYTNSDEQHLNILDLQMRLEQILDNRSDIKGLYLINDNGFMIYANSPGLAHWEPSYAGQDWFRQMNREDVPILSAVHPQSYVNGAAEQVISAGIRLSLNYTQSTGTLMIDYDPKVIEAMSSGIQLGKSGYVFMLTQDGQPENPSGPYPSQLVKRSDFQAFIRGNQGYEVLANGGQTLLVSYYTSTMTGWKIVSIVPFQEVATELSNIRMIMLLLLAIAIIVIFLVASYISRALTNPLRQLERSMRVVGEGNFSRKVSLHRADEIGDLGRQFNRMIEELGRLEQEIYTSKVNEYRLLSLHKESELKALQSQINPHFLYNSLNTMTCIGEIHGLPEVVAVSRGLSDMFKYSIYGPTHTTLSQELQHVQAFLSIMEVRYPGQFGIRFAIDEEVLEAKVLKLLLQPIVENAFVHGFELGDTFGLLVIEGYRSEDRLILVVRDNGRGLGHEKLAALRSELVQDEIMAREGHLGLNNVVQRLKLHYGDLGSLQIDARDGQGMSVTLALPYERMKEENPLVPGVDRG